MSERGQKIFKWIVWIVLIAIVAFSGYKIYYYSKNPVISQMEWLSMVSDSFQIEDMSYIDNGGSSDATGEYAALTIMNAMGEGNIEFLTGKDNLSDQEKIDLAVDKGIVSRGDLKNTLTSASAEEVMDNAMKFYFDMDNYPETFDVTYAGDVISIDKWGDMEFNEEENYIHASSLDSTPVPGQIILPRNEFGIAKPRYVKDCKQLEDGTYEVSLEKIGNPSELLEDISYSGKADFSYLLNASEGAGNDTEETLKVGSANTNKNNMFGLMQVYAAESKNFESKVDIETGGKISIEKKTEDGESFSYNSYLKVKDEKKESKFTVTKDEKGKLKLEPVNNDFTLEAEHEAKTAEVRAKEVEEAKEEKEKGNFEAEGSVSDSFSYNMKLKNLQIASSYCAKGNNDDKFIDVRVTSDVELFWIVEGKFEGKVLITELDLPIHCTAGLISVKLRLYLVVDASGQVSIIYEMDDVSLGVRVAKEGFSAPHSRNKANDRLDITTSISASVGLCGETAISIGDWLDFFEYDIVDPGVEVKFVASAESLKNNEGFEEYPQCVQVKMAAPTVTFRVSENEDSLVFLLLDIFDLTEKVSYDLITEDNAPWKKMYHIETDLDGTSNIIEGDKEYCTHIKLDDEDDITDPAELARKRAEAARKRAEEAARKKAEEARKKAQEEFEKALQDAIDKWLEENCGGC